MQEDIQTFGVNLPHAAEMAAEVSCGDEIAEDHLLHERGVAARDRKRGRNAIGEVRREHEVAEAE